MPDPLPSHPSADCRPSDTGEMTLRDAVLTVLRHAFKIAAFVAVVTALAAVAFFMLPRQYEAEGFLQVIPPVSLEGKVDKDLYETMVNSHLQRVQSSYVAQQTADRLQAKGIKLNVIELRRRVTISRPPKSDLIRVLAETDDASNALSMVQQWIDEYILSLRQNRLDVALNQVRNQLQLAQTDAREKQAAADRMKEILKQTDSMLTVVKAVNDNQLWKELSGTADTEALKKLAGIHISAQEQNEAYPTITESLMKAEETAARATAKWKLLQDVQRHLARVADQPATNGVNPEVSSDGDVAMYVQNLVNNNDIIIYGSAALLSDTHGLVRRTGLVFVLSFCIACLWVLAREWLQQAPREMNARG